MNAFSYRMDFWVRIIVSLVFSLFFLFLGTDSISYIVNGKYFLADLISSFLLIFITTSYISMLSHWFDRHYPWNKQPATRFTYQLIAGILVPSAFVLGYMYLYLIVILGFKREEVPFFNTEFPIAVLFIVFWNALYAGYYFYREQKKAKHALHDLQQQLFTLRNASSGQQIIPTLEERPALEVEPGDESSKTTSANPTRIKVLVAVSGNKNIPIPVQELAYIYKQGNFTHLKTFSGETYLLNHSLDELMSLLDDQVFFRVNRQFIINIRACHYFTNEENGKLALELIPSLDEEVVISQKRAPVFREWLNK